jgi:flagellar biosynthesis/type III secretory pathway protein FliH
MPQQERRSLRPSEAAPPPAPGNLARPPTLPPPSRGATAAADFPVEEPTPLTAAPEPSVDPELLHAFEEAVELLGQERQRVFEQTASQLAELAAVIARRVIAREISLHPQLVYDLVREGLEALGKHDRLVVRLGRGFENERAALEQRLQERESRVEVRVEPNLPEFACLVETELGQVDESVESRLATLLHALRPDSQPAE